MEPDEHYTKMVRSLQMVAACGHMTAAQAVETTLSRRNREWIEAYRDGGVEALIRDVASGGAGDWR